MDDYFVWLFNLFDASYGYKIISDSRAGEKRCLMKRTFYFLIIFALILTGCTALWRHDDIPPNSAASNEVSDETNKGVVDPGHTYGYEQMKTDLDKLLEIYPDIISTDTIGKSVEGRDILLIKLGKGDKKIVLAGAHHAREYMSSTFLMETIDEYAGAYKASEKLGEFDIRALLDEMTIYIIPMVNPDGVNLVQNGIGSVKDPEKVKSLNMGQSGYDEWKANINGVDLNRQYPCRWDAKKGPDGPSSENYKGTKPTTEPEVQAVMNLCKENNFLLAASFHTKGEVIYWADRGTVNEIPAAQQIAETLADVTGYKQNPLSENPAQYAAGFENWFRQDFKRPAFCVELTPMDNSSAPHDDSKFSTLVWGKAKYLCAELIYQAAKLS